MVIRENTNLWIPVWILLCFMLWGGIVVVAGLVLGGCAYSSDGEEDPEPVRVTVLDVGQGLAVLLSRDGRYALYDSGPDSVGVVDSLLARGVDSLSWVLLSHGHRDHAGGFLEMGEALSTGHLHIGRLLVGPDTSSGLVPDSVLRLARRFAIPVDTLVRGDTVWLADGLKLDVLWPPEYGRFGENGASVVMNVTSRMIVKSRGGNMKPSTLDSGLLSSGKCTFSTPIFCTGSFLKSVSV